MTFERKCGRCLNSYDVRDQRCGCCGLRHYEIGQVVEPAPKPTIQINPAHWVDSPQRGPKGVFRNGVR